MKINYTKGQLLSSISLFVAFVCLNFNAIARSCTPPTLSATPTDMSCHGTPNGSVNLTVTSSTPGPYTYSWTSSTGFTSANQNISGLDSGSYTVVVTVAGGCTTTTTVLVSEPAPLNVVTSSNAPFCPGGTLTLYSTVTGGTSSYNYSWSGPQGFTSTDANPGIPSATAIYDSIFTLSVTDAHGCTGSSNFSVLLYPSPIVHLGPDGYICAGNAVTLDAGNAGSTYDWSTGAHTQIISTATVGDYSVTATNFYACSESDTIHLSASPFVVPTVTISTAHDTMCAGVPVTFTATITNGGNNPVFAWRKDGAAIPGATSITYTDVALADHDYITTRLTSDFACASPTTAYSDTIRMRITANTVASVTIAHLPDTACAGTPLTFTATPIGGGPTPFFQWIKAGVVLGTGNTFIYSPTVPETMTVNMVSSITCHTPDTATASSTFVVYPHITPTSIISFTPNDTVAFIGAVTTFYCNETWGGTSPAYQWYVDRVAVPGATNSTYARHVYNNDTVKCVVRSSAVCAIPVRDTSNTVIIYASFLDVTGVNAGNSNISLFPNPNSGDFTISGNMDIKASSEVNVEVRDLKGSVVYRSTFTSQNGLVNEPLSLSDKLPDGVYLLRVSSDSAERQLKLIISK